MTSVTKNTGPQGLLSPSLLALAGAAVGSGIPHHPNQSSRWAPGQALRPSQAGTKPTKRTDPGEHNSLSFTGQRNVWLKKKNIAPRYKN